MVVIFLFQRNRQVNQLNLAVGSSGVGRKVANILVRGFRDWEEVRQEKYIEGIDFFVRNTAHFTEYMILGILWMLCLQSRMENNVTLRKNMLFSVLASGLYAMSDEFHQLFVAGRAGRWMDVGIDTFRAITGILLIAIIIKIFLFVKNKSNKAG